MTEMTTISISKEFQEQLVTLGRKGESYEDLLKRVCPKLRTKTESKEE